MAPDRKCIYCAIYKQNGGKCPIFAQDVSQERGCPLYTTQLDPCEICGKHITGNKILRLEEESVHQICANCDDIISAQACQVCEGMMYCAFQQDQSCKLQPYVVVQQRQGNAVVQMQQKNPERIAATCAKGCKCYHNGYCCRESGICENHQVAWNHFKK